MTQLALTHLLILSMVVPIVGAIIISRLDKHINLRETATIVTAVILFIINVDIYLSLDLSHAKDVAASRLTFAEPIEGLSIAFSATAFGSLFALIASGLWIATSIYAIGYMRGHNEKYQTRFYVLFAVAIAGVMAVAYSDNLFTLFLFYEILTVSTYPLVTHEGTRDARKGGKTYILILMGSSILFFLPAMVIVWFVSGTLTFQEGGILAGNLDMIWAAPLLILFLFGISKAGLMPLHRWLPSAMVAPTPVSALLHAVAVVKAGVFSVMKVVVFIFGADFITESGANHWLIWIPLTTIVLASFIALTKDNLKERLAYSTVSQLSYIILGALLANEAGIIGGTMHIAMHAFAKISLFFAAGAILVASHKKYVSELAGLGRVMPFTFAVFTIGTLSIIGLPFFGGMWSKYYLVSGGLSFTGPAATYWAVLIGLTVSSLLNIYYLLSIPMTAFFNKPVKTSADHSHDSHGDPNSVRQGIKEAPFACLIGMAIPTLMTLYLFFDPQVFYRLSSTLANF
ncbi:proton-conducting transporter membrane subunit [Brumicola nitratireducens]|uniref:NADH dehydrogenase (Quinone) n=1 Tax=Glaciecola nitratireducens (strain JCM 12485 / KCTC 12276 / FR1064) TaxID=1085623 RepID=G4QK82_GLANF|nr:proton-conducting transporter membrane subunit [Glaciecola nitratireducens]AEP29281.1 NADH dehydrogenase (quinone) [Glaciecola nitratireducens FR1064]